MDDDIRAQIVNEIASTDYCIERSPEGTVEKATWKGYRIALRWALYLIDKEDVDEDPVLTSEEME